MKQIKAFTCAVLCVLLAAGFASAGSQIIKVDGSIGERTPTVNVTVNSTAAFEFELHIPMFRMNDVQREGQTWQRIVFENASQRAMPGEPELPVFTRFIAVPQGAEPQVKVVVTGAKEMDGVNCLPAQEAVAECYDDAPPSFTIKQALYDTNAFFPGYIYKVEGPFTIRGLRMIRLDVYPVQVNPATGEATLITDLEVAIDFQGSKGKFFSDRRGRNFQAIYETAMNRMSFANEPPPALTGKSPNGAEFVILSAPDLADAAQTLADWKNLQGYDTEVYTTADSGTSIAEIKAWVQDAYDTWDPTPEFILFFGDAEFISPTYDDPQTASDLHYVTVEGDDEWEDIFHARISVDTLAEAEKRVADIIRYERTPIEDPSFYNTATQAAYFQPGYYDPDYAERRFCRTTEEIYQWFNNVMPDSPFVSNRIYFTDNYCTPLYWNQDDYNWSLQWWLDAGLSPLNIPEDLLRANGFAWDGNAVDITAAVNGGTGFLTHRDHGDVDGWSEPAFNNADVQALANGELQPVLWSINCLTGYFDNETAGASHSIAFTELWERHANGGAVGILGSTRISYSGRNDRMVQGWMDSMFPDYEPDWPIAAANEPEYRMSPLMMYGKLYMSYHYADDPYRMIAIREFHWFGDPTFEMYAGDPGDLVVDHLPLIPMGAVSFEVGVDADNALVALTQNGMILGKAYSSGGTANIVFDGPITAVEDVHLVVTRYNYRPYEADLLVGATSTGIINLDSPAYTEDSTIEIVLSDADLIGEGTYTLHIDSDSEPAGEDIVCDELIVGDPTGTFFGSLETTTAAPAEADGMLSIANGDTITLYYYDEDTGAGSPADLTDTAYADTEAPTFAGAADAAGGDHEVLVTWNAATDLTAPITYQVYRAETSGGQNFATPLATTGNLQYTDRGLPNMYEWFYVVRATDAFGHQDSNTVEVVDFTVGPVSFWEEDFDPNGIPDTWTILDMPDHTAARHWNTDNPGQRSSEYWENLFAIADSDDTGSGPYWSTYLITEPINCSGYTDVRLLFSHYYYSCCDDTARVDISLDDGLTWETVYDYTGTSDEGWEDLDLSEWADNTDGVRLGFYYAGDYAWYWGVDNLEMIGMVSDDPPSIADFTADLTAGAAPLTVEFAATTSGLITQYAWDFGDGNTATEAKPVHTYTAIGTYTVSLTVTSIYGEDSLTKTDLITVSCPVPALEFTADTTTGEAPLTVNFTDLSEAFAGCEPTAIAWDFGDGHTATDVTNPSNTYTAPGTYTVSLSYTVGDTDEVVTETKEAYITATCGLPEAEFTADVTTGDAPLTVHLTDASVTATGCEITQWTWAYGLSENDLQTVNDQNPTIVLEESGSYLVALRVTNAAGLDEEIKNNFIIVTETASDDDDNDASPTDDDDDDDLSPTDDDDTSPADNGDDEDDDDDDDSCGCS